MITINTKIDMRHGAVPKVIPLSQYDSDFTLTFDLYASDGSFTVQSGTTAAIRGTKTDGEPFSMDATVSGSTVTVTGTHEQMQQLTAAAGRNVFELTLYKSGKELNTSNFIIFCERAAMDKDTIGGQSVIRELVSVIDRTDELIGAATQIRADKIAVEGYKNNAADSADAAASSATSASGSASEAAQSAATAANTVNGALDAITSARQGAIAQISSEKSEAIEDITDAYETKIADINQKGAQIVAITTNAEQIASRALSSATNAENHMGVLDNKMDALEAAMQNVSIDPDDLGLEQDPDTYYVYPTYKGVRSENGIPLAGGGGGGGGGGDVISAALTVENTSGFLSKTIVDGAGCIVSFRWSSIENEMATGDGTLRITVDEVVRATTQIQQGNVSADLGPFLSTGTHKVKVRISDVYDQGKTTTFNITSVSLSISSTFETSQPYTSTITFPCTPVGNVDKTIYVEVDNRVVATQETSLSNRQITLSIPAQTHGGHSLKAYFTAEINGETVTSNVLYYEFMFLEPLNGNTIIVSPFSATSVSQYASVPIPFTVYNPSALTAEVKIYVNNSLVSTQTVDRTEQSYTIRVNTPGTVTVRLESGNATKTITFTVTESSVDVEAVTEDLVLYLDAEGRSNNEANPGTWTYGEGASQIACTFSGFNFVTDGWQTDDNGDVLLRVAGDARLTIPYKPFATDFRGTGKTIEVEFATRNVLDYDSVIMSCFSGNRGLQLTAQRSTLKSSQSQLAVQYKEEDHIRVAYVVEKRSENRLLYVFINGIPSGVVQYPADDDFSQATPVNISIGSNDCTMDIYCIRVYDNDLTRHQILENWIADTQDATLMLSRYTRNNLYDAYGKIVIASLPSDLPYFILDAEQLPQYKGDKKTISGQYVDPLYPSKSFTFNGCQINVQGTSSAPYARKNYDMQFKNGIELATGHADNYALRPGAIPFNRFVLKADVASSEGANNVELVRLYNDICPYKTPEMVQDPRVRWGIDGFPIVVFWNDITKGEVSFLGKYNFNLPKRAPDPYGYAGSDTMESWELENNTSDLLLFKSDYFDMTPYVNDDGDTVPSWRKDFEARFPSDAWLDITILQEFVSFVVSTDRTRATGDTLETPVTYQEYNDATGEFDDVVYTTDTAAYRLARFREEFPTYAEKDTFVFYYIFTELFLMMDSRAKNLFIGFNGSSVTASGRAATRKATAQPYDMDTGLGTNNEGALVYGYSLEDIDHLAGGAAVFNGQDSVLWCNVRDAYESDIIQMYQTLRSNGILSYPSVEARYEEHQSKWPEAIWIEDAWFKYIDPLINPDPGKAPTDTYLSMMQGSKEEQRKWWLTNRFRYMDSKWIAGEALSEVIQLRGYAKANITVTPYADIYPTVKYGSYVEQERGTHGQPTTLVCPLDNVNDTEIYIYSAPQLASVGDLSGLKVGFADFSKATRLQSIKIGDASQSYDNPNLYQFTPGSNKLLQTVDVRNCSGLGDTTMEGHRQRAVDLSGCEILENVYFSGTKIAGLTLPNGGNLKVLDLPDTITSLVIQNQPGITTFSVEGGDYSNIETLRIENCGSAIPVEDILADMPANSRVRIIGFTLAVSSTTEVEDFYDFLDTMRGLDEQGNNTDTAQVQGTITGLATITGAWYAQMLARYPYITIAYEHITSTLRYYNGETLITTETISDGGNGSYSGTTPTKAATAQYSYTFAGWSKDTDDNTVDANALTGVVADRNVYACYTATLQTYTVIWMSGTTTLRTDSNVAWGSTPTWGQAMPTKDGQTATGWDRDLTQPITGNTTINATYKPLYTATFVRGSADGGGTLLTAQFEEGATVVYTGATPTSTQGTATDYPFEGWSPALGPIYANTTYTAQFGSPVQDVEITDSWDTIIANIDNGTYRSAYKIGNYKPLDLDTEGTINMQIVAIDTDDLASGGKAPLTFIGKELLETMHRMNPAVEGSTGNYTIGTGAIGGWENCEMRSYLRNTIKPLIPNNIRNRINIVAKTQKATDATGTEFIQTTADDVWIPSSREVGYTSYEQTGLIYNKIYMNSASRIKSQILGTQVWYTRTTLGASQWARVAQNGTVSTNYSDGTRNYAIALGFCLGLES